jgi:hypothetical protein
LKRLKVGGGEANFSYSVNPETCVIDNPTPSSFQSVNWFVSREEPVKPLISTEEGAAGWAGIRDGRAIRADEIKLVKGVHVHIVCAHQRHTLAQVYSPCIVRDGSGKIKEENKRTRGIEK